MLLSAVSLSGVDIPSMPSVLPYKYFFLFPCNEFHIRTSGEFYDSYCAHSLGTYKIGNIDDCPLDNMPYVFDVVFAFSSIIVPIFASVIAVF